MSLARISRSVNAVAISLGVLAVVLALLAFTDTASARPHGITIRCGHHKCHHRSKHKHRCNRSKGHKKRKCHGHNGHTPFVPPFAHPPHKKVPTKQGPICDPHVFATSPNPEECEEPVVDGPGVEVGEPPAREELSIGQIEIFWPGPKTLPGIRACGTVKGAYGDKLLVTFEAEEGSFEQSYYAGTPKGYWPERYCAVYSEPPCPEDSSKSPWCEKTITDDEVWAVVLDESTGMSAESEHVTFEFEEPEGGK